MNEPQGQYQVPAPFVTHEQMGGVHQSIGELRQGQASIMSTYNHLRGDMLSGFEKLEKAILTSASAQAKAREPEQGGLNLSVREAFIACFAIMAGTALITNMATAQKPPMETVRRAADVLIP